MQWLLAHPEFRTNPVYIAGDSYNGITVPVIVEKISDGKLSLIKFLPTILNGCSVPEFNQFIDVLVYLFFPCHLS